MYEIEVKAKIKNKENIITSLEELGVHFEKSVGQSDVIYIKGEWTDFINDPNRIVFRIRRQDDTAILTLKKHGHNELNGIEHETEVADPEQVNQMLLLIGYVPFIEVNKKRSKAHYKDLEICIDEVEGLGSFIEVEKLSEKDDEEGQEELFSFLKDLGVNPEDRVTKGYDTLLRELRNN